MSDENTTENTGEEAKAKPAKAAKASCACKGNCEQIEKRVERIEKTLRLV